jgi:hypothetical protein
MTALEKNCPKCGTVKLAAAFYQNAKRPDGLSSYCRQCQVADTKSRYSAHPRWRAPEGQKWCPGCKDTLPVDLFGKNARSHDGLQSYCKRCSVASVTRSRHKDPTSHRRSSKAWRESNVERHADNGARWRYGVEHGTYAQMLEAQGGRCAICRCSSPGPRLARFHIDHDHVTGSIRGLLCSPCNTGIGQLGHDLPLMKAAAAYLEATAAVSTRTVEVDQPKLEE